MRDRLVELISEAREECTSTSCFQCEYQDKEMPKGCVPRLIADHLLANSVIVPPCKVGDTVYYINTRYHIALYRNRVYEAKVARIVVTTLGVALVIQIRDESGCCEIPDVKDFGKTVFLHREEAEQALLKP